MNKLLVVLVAVALCSSAVFAQKQKFILDGLWKFHDAADDDVCDDLAAFALEAKTDVNGGLTMTPTPASLTYAGQVVASWDALSGKGADGVFELNGKSWSHCNLTQTNNEIYLYCSLAEGGACNFRYMCAAGPCTGSEPEENDTPAAAPEEPQRFYTWKDLPGVHNLTAPQISQCQTAQYLRNVGFNANLAKMVCTAYYESSWNCGAVSRPNGDGTVDYGLMQINSYWWCSGGAKSRYNGCNASCQSMLNCQTNARCARTVFDQQGINAWYAYKSHKAICDNYRINC